MCPYKLFLTISVGLLALGCKSQSDFINQSGNTFSSKFTVLDTSQTVIHDIADLSQKTFPTEAQINLADQILLANLPDTVYDRIRAKNWRRQYFGYLNAKSETVIYANFLNFKRRQEAKKYFPEWENQLIIGYGDFFEKNTYRFLVNLTTKKIEVY